MKDLESNTLQTAIRVIPASLRMKIGNVVTSVADRVQDIVLRSELPICMYVGDKQMYLTKNGCLANSSNSQDMLIASQQDVLECFNNICGYSVYSHISEIKEGFITIKGGHRAGIAGTAVVSSGSIHNIRDISSVSIRISRQIKGVAEGLTCDYERDNGGLLICGSPCSGKTTIIRDMGRLLSTVYESRVSLIDTRGEIAAVSQGISQNDVGMCDILNGYPRADGIEQAVRSLSPKYIICDEIGSSQDVKAITSGVNSGVRFIATIHSDNRDELLSRRNAKDILGTGAFKMIVFLSGREKPGVIREKYTLEEILSA